MQGILSNCQGFGDLCKSTALNKVISLPDIDDETGHTLVHYLYTGTYQTLKLLNVSGDAKRLCEYKRSVRTYCVARKYGIAGLEVLAKTFIERFKDQVSIVDALETAEEAYRKLPKDDVWFTSYLEDEIRAALKADGAFFTRKTFLGRIGNLHEFDSALVRIMARIYINPERPASCLKEGVFRGQHFQPDDEFAIAVPSVPKEPSYPSEPLVEEALVEEALIEEPLAEEPLYDEAWPCPEEPPSSFHEEPVAVLCLPIEATSVGTYSPKLEAEDSWSFGGFKDKKPKKSKKMAKPSIDWVECDEDQTAPQPVGWGSFH